MPPPQPSKGELTRQSILTAAEARFAELGFDAARLEEVADAVGIKRAAIFYHFTSKQELFDELTCDIKSSLIALTQERLRDIPNPWEKLMLLIEAWLEFMLARPTAARLILRQCANGTHGLTESATEAADPMQLLRDVISEGIASGHFANVHSMYLINLLSGSILHYVCNPEQLGKDHAYRPDDPREVAAFKAILRKTARVVLDLQQ